MLSFTFLLIGSLELFATLADGLVYHNSHLPDSLVHSPEDHPGNAVPSRSLKGSPSHHRSLWHQLKPGVYQAESTTKVAVFSMIPEATGGTSRFPNPTPVPPQIIEGPTSRSFVAPTPHESGRIAEESLAPSPSSFSFQIHGDLVSLSGFIATIATLAASTAQPTTSATTPQAGPTQSISVSSSQTPIDASVTSDSVVSQTSFSSASVSTSDTSNSGTSSTVSSGPSTNNGSQWSTPYPTASSKSSNATTSPLESSSSMAPQRANGTRSHHAPFPSSSLTVPPADSTAVGFNPSSVKKLGHSTAAVASRSQDPAESSTFTPNFSYPPSPAFVSAPPSSSEMHISSIYTGRSQSVASATAAVTPNPASSKTGLNSGGVIGVVMGVVLLLSVLSGLLFYICRRSPRTQPDVAIAPSPQSFPPDSEKALPQSNVVEVPHVGNFLMATAGADGSGLESESPTGTPQVGCDNAALYVANLAASFDEDRWSVPRMLAAYSFPRPPVQGPTIANAAALTEHGPNNKPAYEDDFFVITLSEH